jgi:hypothetical protein
LGKIAEIAHHNITFSISPSMADSKEDFPDPTVPTTATSSPGLTDSSRFFSVDLLDLSHVKLPFSI